MLKLKNCKDIDYIPNSKIPSITAILNEYTQGNNHPLDAYKTLYLYQLSNGFHNEESYDFKDFNIFNYKTIWIQQLQNHFAILNLQQIAQLQVLPKFFYHYLYQYYMIIENTHYISNGAKEPVQKIHDLQMPGEYVYELSNLIYSLSNL